MELKLKELKPEQHFTAAGTLHRGFTCKDYGRAWNRTSKYVCADHHNDHQQTLCIQGTENLYVTELGEVVNNIMKQAFPSIVDVNFTATMEGLLDCVEAGTVQWKTVVRNFYRI